MRRPPGTVSTAVAARRTGLRRARLMHLHRTWGIGTRVGNVVWWTEREIDLIRANTVVVPEHHPWYVGIYGSGFTEYRQVIGEWMYRNRVRQTALARQVGLARQNVNFHIGGRIRRLTKALALRFGELTGYAPAYIYMLSKTQRRPGVQKRSFPIRPARRLTPQEIINWRQQHRVSIRGLADLLDISRNTVLKWESGERTPPAMLDLALEELARRLKWGGYRPPNISTLAVSKRHLPAAAPCSDDDEEEPVE